MGVLRREEKTPQKTGLEEQRASYEDNSIDPEDRIWAERCYRLRTTTASQGDVKGFRNENFSYGKKETVVRVAE